MYCRYCGQTIDSKTLKCTSCGRENGPLTGGTSFWDVADPGRTLRQPPAAPPEKLPEPEKSSAGSGEKKKDPTKLLLIGCAALGVLLLAISLILLGGIQSARKDIEALSGRIAAMEKENDLNAMKTELNEKLDELSALLGERETPTAGETPSDAPQTTEAPTEIQAPGETDETKAPAETENNQGGAGKGGAP